MNISPFLSVNQSCDETLQRKKTIITSQFMRRANFRFAYRASRIARLSLSEPWDGRM